MPLMKWIWRSYFRTSLVPLLFVEVALVSMYFIATIITNRENIDTVRLLAEQELQRTALRQANGINHQLEGVRSATDLLRKQAETVMLTQQSFPQDDPSRFAYSAEGAYYSTRSDGKSAVFYSGAVPVGAAERRKALRSAGMDATFKAVTESFPLIVQVYINTHDSLNRIYPYFDVLSQYAPRMDIPSFNFYYEADARHNPERKVVWTDVYVDPAGKGWMTSAIAPVYEDDRLEAVVGSDITVSTIISDVLNMQLPWGGYGMLLSRDGTIMAMPSPGEADWGVREATMHFYEGAIRQDTFKPEAFNLYKRKGAEAFAKALGRHGSGFRHMRLAEDKIVSWVTIPETGWKLLLVVPESLIYAPAQTLSARLSAIAWLMISGMVLFYLVFFGMLYRRARRMSEFVARPLTQIDAMISGISAGQYQQSVPEIPVDELRRTAEQVSLMGAKLHSARLLRDRAERALLEKTHHLQSVFDLSPDGFIALDPAGKVSMVNPAFCRMTDLRREEWEGLDEAEFWDKLGRICQRELPRDSEIFQFELLRPRRRLLQCHVSRSAASQSAVAVVYLRDITKESQLDRMKSEFVATAAHELRTPLTSILGYAELLKARALSSTMQEETLDTILRQSRALALLIQDLLDVARIESRMGLDLDIRPCVLAELAESALQAFFIPEGRLPVSAHIPENVQVMVDAGRLQQALLNALDNAYKYSTEGEVALCMVNHVDPSARMVGLQVRDHGIGMTPEQLDQVFDRFWRGDTSGRIPGTGLGMAIARELMLLMEGEIEIVSEPGEGSAVTFWMRLANVVQEKDEHAE
jgi:PAS domain S-box-containing protein